MDALFVLAEVGRRRMKAPRARLNQTNKHASRQRFGGEKIRFSMGSGNADCVSWRVILSAHGSGFKETTDPARAGG